MAAKTVVAGSSVSASQLKDLFRQIEDGSINGRIMQAVLEHRNPWEAPTGFEVVSDGRTGEQFIASLESASYKASDYAKDVMRKPPFVSTTGQKYKLVVIKGEEFEDDDRITSKIRAEADRRDYRVPPAEVAPLLRELVSDEEIERMGLYWLIVMHEPITDSDGRPRVLGIHRYGKGRWLNACHGRADGRWGREGGFVFLAPQDSPQV